MDPDGNQVQLGYTTGYMKGFGVLGLQAVPEPPSRKDSLPISHLYIIGLQDDGNGNSREQPPQGKDRNGMLSSYSTDKLAAVHKKTHLQAFITQLHLSSNALLETTRPPSACRGFTGVTGGTVCRGKRPLRALLCPLA